MKKIPGWVITAAALVLSVILAANFIKANKGAADQIKSADPDEGIVIIAKSNYKEIESSLKEYSEDISQKEALKSGMIVVKNQEFQEDSDKLWKKFLEKIRKKKDGAVIICQFTTEGDPILQYISYLDGKFYYVEDATRDQFGGEEYVEHTYDYFKRFEEQKLYTAFLTNKEEITLAEAQDARNLKTAIQILEVKTDQGKQ